MGKKNSGKRISAFGQNAHVFLLTLTEVKHDVYGRRQTAKISTDFLFFSCKP